MRANAKPNDVLRALAKAIEATFVRGDWLDLALLTDTEQVVTGHRRLLRSLEWNDPDYSGNVLQVLPSILGDRGLGRREAVSTAERFPNLQIVEDHEAPARPAARVPHEPEASAPCSAAGPTARSTATAENAPPRLTADYGPTTITADTQPSAANHPSHS